MKKLLLQLILKLGLKPGQKTVARQLRQPSGKMGKEVGKRMNQSNEFMFNWVTAQMHIQPQQHLLEIGFGNGNFFEKVFALADGLKISGIDFSEVMYKEALANCAPRVAAGSLSLTFGSSDKMPFANNSFDKIYCTNVVYFWEKPQQHLAEIYRVLKPGGRFYAGIRTKETMQLMPFTQYGFALRSNEEWQGVIEESPLAFISLDTVAEPEMTINAVQFTPYTGCIIAEKQV